MEYGEGRGVDVCDGVVEGVRKSGGESVELRFGLNRGVFEKKK